MWFTFILTEIEFAGCRKNFSRLHEVQPYVVQNRAPSPWMEERRSGCERRTPAAPTLTLPGRGEGIQFRPLFVWRGIMPSTARAEAAGLSAPVGFDTVPNRKAGSWRGQFFGESSTIRAWGSRFP